MLNDAVGLCGFECAWGRYDGTGERLGVEDKLDTDKSLLVRCPF